MNRAAKGSAHHQPNSRLRSRPTRRARDMYAQVTLHAASAFRAVLPIRLATRSLPCHKRGIMMAAATARPTSPPGGFGLGFCNKGESAVGNDVDGKGEQAHCRHPGCAPFRLPDTFEKASTLLHQQSPGENTPCDQFNPDTQAHLSLASRRW